MKTIGSKLLILVLAVSMFMTGCSAAKAKADNEITGASWKTWGPYSEVEWSSPEGTKTICIRVSEDPAELIFIEDEDSYIEICKASLHEKTIGDMNMVRDSIRSVDYNGNGYDEIIVQDREAEGTFENVYTWDKTKGIFVYDDDMSEYIEDVSLVGTDVDFEPEGLDDPESEVNALASMIVDYYTFNYEAAGNYVIFDNEITENDAAIEFIVRYQMSDEEAEEILANDSFPEPNIYVTTVTFDKENRTAIDEAGNPVEL